MLSFKQRDIVRFQVLFTFCNMATKDGHGHGVDFYKKNSKNECTTRATNGWYNNYVRWAEKNGRPSNIQNVEKSELNGILEVYFAWKRGVCFVCVRALNTLTYGLSCVMRYIFLVLFSINCTRATHSCN